MIINMLEDKQPNDVCISETIRNYYIKCYTNSVINTDNDYYPIWTWTGGHNVYMSAYNIICT